MRIEIVTINCHLSDKRNKELKELSEHIAWDLFDHCRNWTYENQQTVLDVMNRRFEFILSSYTPERAKLVRENIAFQAHTLPARDNDKRTHLLNTKGWEK